MANSVGIPDATSLGFGSGGGSSDVASNFAFESHLQICKSKSWALSINLFGTASATSYRPKPFAQPSGICFPEPCTAEGDDDDSQSDGQLKSIRVFRNKRSSAALSWDGLLNTQRIAAIRKWVGIISASPWCFHLGRRWNRLDPLGAFLHS